jgi:hypothetical protein
MRAISILGLVALASCAAPGDLPAPSGSARPVVGHVRMRGRIIDLTVDSVDAREGVIELRRATAHHEAEPAVWAGTDDRFFER